MVLKKKKDPNTNIKPEVDPKDVVVWDEYTNLNDGMRHPMNNMIADKMARDLIAWSKNDDYENDKEALNIYDFLCDHGILLTTFYKWIEKHEGLREANRYALNKIAARRERGATKKRYDASSVYRMQGHYDPEYKKQMEWQAKLRAQENKEANEQKIVVIERYPETDKVPKK